MYRKIKNGLVFDAYATNIYIFNNWFCNNNFIGKPKGFHQNVHCEQNSMHYNKINSKVTKSSEISIALAATDNFFSQNKCEKVKQSASPVFKTEKINSKLNGECKKKFQSDFINAKELEFLVKKAAGVIVLKDNSNNKTVLFDFYKDATGQSNYYSKNYFSSVNENGNWKKALQLILSAISRNADLKVSGTSKQLIPTWQTYKAIVDVIAVNLLACSLKNTEDSFNGDYRSALSAVDLLANSNMSKTAVRRLLLHTSISFFKALYLDLQDYDTFKKISRLSLSFAYLLRAVYDMTPSDALNINLSDVYLVAESLTIQLKLNNMYVLDVISPHNENICYEWDINNIDNYFFGYSPICHFGTSNVKDYFSEVKENNTKVIAELLKLPLWISYMLCKREKNKSVQTSSFIFPAELLKLFLIGAAQGSLMFGFKNRFLYLNSFLKYLSSRENISFISNIGSTLEKEGITSAFVWNHGLQTFEKLKCSVSLDNATPFTIDNKQLSLLENFGNNKDNSRTSSNEKCRLSFRNVMDSLEYSDYLLPSAGPEYLHAAYKENFIHDKGLEIFVNASQDIRMDYESIVLLIGVLIKNGFADYRSNKVKHPLRTTSRENHSIFNFIKSKDELLSFSNKTAEEIDETTGEKNEGLSLWKSIFDLIDKHLSYSIEIENFQEKKKNEIRNEIYCSPQLNFYLDILSYAMRSATLFNGHPLFSKIEQQTNKYISPKKLQEMCLELYKKRVLLESERIVTLNKIKLLPETHPQRLALYNSLKSFIKKKSVESYGLIFQNRCSQSNESNNEKLFNEKEKTIDIQCQQLFSLFVPRITPLSASSLIGCFCFFDCIYETQNKLSIPICDTIVNRHKWSEALNFVTHVEKSNPYVNITYNNGESTKCRIIWRLCDLAPTIISAGYALEIDNAVYLLELVRITELLNIHKNERRSSEISFQVVIKSLWKVVRESYNKSLSSLKHNNALNKNLHDNIKEAVIEEKKQETSYINLLEYCLKHAYDLLLDPADPLFVSEIAKYGAGLIEQLRDRLGEKKMLLALLATERLSESDKSLSCAVEAELLSVSSAALTSSVLSALRHWFFKRSKADEAAALADKHELWNKNLAVDVDSKVCPNLFYSTAIEGHQGFVDCILLPLFLHCKKWELSLLAGIYIISDICKNEVIGLENQDQGVDEFGFIPETIDRCLETTSKMIRKIIHTINMRLKRKGESKPISNTILSVQFALCNLYNMRIEELLRISFACDDDIVIEISSSQVISLNLLQRCVCILNLVFGAPQHCQTTDIVTSSRKPSLIIKDHFCEQTLLLGLHLLKQYNELNPSLPLQNYTSCDDTLVVHKLCVYLTAAGFVTEALWVARYVETSIGFPKSADPYSRIVGAVLCADNYCCSNRRTNLSYSSAKKLENEQVDDALLNYCNVILLVENGQLDLAFLQLKNVVLTVSEIQNHGGAGLENSAAAEKISDEKEDSVIESIYARITVHDAVAVVLRARLLRAAATRVGCCISNKIKNEDCEVLATLWPFVLYLELQPLTRISPTFFSAIQDAMVCSFVVACNLYTGVKSSQKSLLQFSGSITLNPAVPFSFSELVEVCIEVILRLAATTHRVSPDLIAVCAVELVFAEMVSLESKLSRAGCSYAEKYLARLRLQVQRRLSSRVHSNNDAQQSRSILHITDLPALLDALYEIVRMKRGHKASRHDSSISQLGISSIMNEFKGVTSVKTPYGGSFSVNAKLLTLLRFLVQLENRIAGVGSCTLDVRANSQKAVLRHLIIRIDRISHMVAKK